MYKVLIRPLTIEDAETSFRWRNNPEIWEYTGNKPSREITPEIEKDWLQNSLCDKTAARFAIMVDDTYVGNIQLTDINNETAQYHIFIGEKDYWGKGIAKLATSQILRYANNCLRLNKVFLKVNPLNISAIKLYCNCGFVKLDDEITMEIELKHKPLAVVSVFMMAFNHENFITQAVEGVLMQKTDFDFDIVIGEDCSTDDTRNKIIALQQKYPGKFKLLLHNKNIGAMANQMAILNECTGKYIALCEGDDYWTDPYKLQKQVDFLEGNEEYSICFHPVKLRKESENDIVDDYMTREVPETTTILDLAYGNYIHTPSVVFRKNQDVLDTLHSLGALTVGDYVLHMLNAKHGNIKKLPEVMGIYRVHSGGVHSQKSPFRKYLEWITLLEDISVYFNTNVTQIFSKTILELIDITVADWSKLSENDKTPLLEMISGKPEYITKIICKIEEQSHIINQLYNEINSKNLQSKSIKKNLKRTLCLILERFK